MYYRETPNGFRITMVLVITVVALGLLTGGVSATPTDVTGCQVIDQPGTWILTGDVDDGGYGYCIDIRTSDVVLDGNGHTLNNSGASNREAIRVSGQYDGGTNVTIRNVTLTNWNMAMYLQSSPKVTVTNVHVDDAHTGLDATGTVEVSGSSFVNITSVGISSSQDTVTVIRNVTVVSDDDGMLLSGPVTVEDSDVITSAGLTTGITLQGDSTYESPYDATIRNNTIRGGYRVISISKGANATVVDNTLVGDGDADGVALDYRTDSGDGPVNALVDGNNISDVDDGIIVMAYNRTKSLAEIDLVGNTIRNASAGVQINEDPQSQFVSWILDPNLTYDLDGNTIENATNGVYVQGTSGSLSDNWFNTTYSSVILNNTTATLTGNDATSALSTSVSITDGGTVTIDGDQYHDSFHGVRAIDSEVVAHNPVVENVSQNGYYAENSTLIVSGGTVSGTTKAYVASARFATWVNMTVSGATLTDVKRAGEADFGNLTVSDTTVTMADDSSLEAFYAQAGNLTLDGVTVQQAGDAGMSSAVHGRYGSNVTVANSAFDDAETGVLLKNSTGTIVTNTIRNASLHAVNATNASVTVADNAIHNATKNEIGAGGAIELTHTSGIVTDNEIESNWVGVESIEASAEIAGNNITSALYGVEYTDSTGPILNNTLDGGMYLKGVQNGDPTEVLVENNVIDVEGFRNGISVAWNVRAQIRDNEITGDRKGVRLYLATGANVTGNTITIRANDDEESAGVAVRESTSITRPDEIEPFQVLGNEISGGVGIQIGDQYNQDIHPDRVLTILGNDFSATEIVVYNRNATAVEVPLNYYGPHGPTDHEFVGPVTDIEPFLTEPSDGSGDLHAYLDSQAFAYSLDMAAGRVYAMGTPAGLEDNLSETFGDFDGAVYRYDEATQAWTLATGDEVLGPMEAVVVVPETDARAVVDFADATPARPTERQVSEGWNFVGPRHYAGAEDAYSTGTTSLTDLLDVYTHPAGQPYAPGVDFGGRYAFADGATGPRVSPFAGYFVYATEDGTIPGTVPTGVTYEKVVQLLEQED